MTQIEIGPEQIQIDADIVAKALKMEPQDLLGRMREGTVTSQFERGEGADAGRVRLTFFSATRRARITADTAGAICLALRRTIVGHGRRCWPPRRHQTASVLTQCWTRHCKRRFPRAIPSPSVSMARNERAGGGCVDKPRASLKHLRAGSLARLSTLDKHPRPITATGPGAERASEGRGRRLREGRDEPRFSDHTRLF